MPSQAPHQRLYTAAAPLAGLAAVAFIVHPSVSVGIVAGYALGNFCDPDLDIGDKKTRAEIQMYKRSRVLGFLWWLFWLPYAKLIPHRSFFSHSIFFSTVFRLAYMFWWIAFIPPQRWLDALTVGVFVGLLIADSVHIFADIFLDQDGKMKAWSW